MNDAPQTIGGARVILYSPIDRRHRPTGGCRQIVAGVVQGPAAGLAICRYDGEDACYLCGCDGDWNCVTDTWHQTVRDAMAQGEFEYEGVWRTWQSHRLAWEPLSDEETGAVWDQFYEQFAFRPSVEPSKWPGIREPVPSVTYDIRHVFEGQMDAGADPNEEALTLFKQCVDPGERLYALDWQHQCYRFDPFGVQTDPRAGSIPVVPDGDYSMFVTEDFRLGTFGHPWEGTICVFGAALLDAVAREPPGLFARVVRRDGIGT